MSDLKKCMPVGGELGTSSSKFCCDDTIVLFSSVVGDALSESMEKSWRLMNRSSDQRWIKNLAIYDDNRNSWRYVGAMTRNSEKTNWFTHKGLIQNYDDAFLTIKAGLFLLHNEMTKKNKSFNEVGLGFGITVRHGESVIEKFFSFLKEKQKEENGQKFIPIKAKNVATNEVKEIKLELSFCVMQYQAYGAYMSVLFSKFNMEIYDTYVIDIGHGTWIKLPIIENEADITLSDSITEGIFTITRNISRLIFDNSGQKFKIPEQRIMEKLPNKDYKIEVPSIGIFDFTDLLKQEAQNMAQSIVEKVQNDLSVISQKGQAIDYFVITGGGAHLLYDDIKEKISEFFGWTKEIADQRIISPKSIGMDVRHINCAGFMLLARDQIASELEEEVDPNFKIKNVVQDFSYDTDQKGEAKAKQVKVVKTVKKDVLNKNALKQENKNPFVKKQ